MLTSRIVRVSRIVRTLAIVLFAATMLPLPGHAASSKTTDFSAGLLTPADYAEFGFDDYGVDSGRLVSLPQMIRGSGAPNWDDPAFAEAGIERVYMLHVHPIGGLAEHPGADISFSSIIFVFEDEATADEGFDFYEDESDDPTATDHEDAAELGDDSELTEYVDTWEEDGKTWAFNGYDFTFRIGEVTATVSVNGYDEEVDRDVVEEIAAYYFEKLETLIEDGEVDGARTPGLDTIVPRYEGQEVLPSRSHYCALNGEAMPHAYDPGADAVSKERIEKFDLVASYCNLQQLFVDEADDAYLLLNIEPLRFKKASGAEEFVAAEIEELTEGDETFEAEAIDVEELPFEADEAWLYSYQREFDGVEYEVAELIVRDGKFVYEVRLNGLEAPSMDIMLDLMTDTVTCADEPCTSTLELPESVLEFIQEQAEIYEEM